MAVVARWRDHRDRTHPVALAIAALLWLRSVAPLPARAPGVTSEELHLLTNSRSSLLVSISLPVYFVLKLLEVFHRAVIFFLCSNKCFLELFP